MFNKRNEKFKEFSTVDLITIHKEILNREVDIAIMLDEKKFGQDLASIKEVITKLSKIRKSLISEILTRFLELDD